MRNCFILISVTAATAASLPPTSAGKSNTVMLVVRSDSQTGRLVRSVATGAKARSASPQIELPVPAEVPAAFAKLVDEIAARHAVDRDLVHSMIAVESNYNPLAVSEKGALGLMQLVPSTARRFGVADAFNPEQNVEGGVRYLKYLLDLYDGDRRWALAAYNAGEGTVERYGGVPPYAETRSYINRVDKRLGEKKEAKKQEEAASAKSTDGFNPIHAFIDAMGRICYRTP